MATLARQLERYREQLPAWIEQRTAVQTVVARKERVLEDWEAEVDHLRGARFVIERAYTAKHEVLVRAFELEVHKAAGGTDTLRVELERSLELERLTTRVLDEGETKGRALRATLDQTVTQLDHVRSAIVQCQVAAQPLVSEKPSQELQYALRRVEATRKQWDRVRAEHRVVQAEVQDAQAELLMQRSYSERLEAFVRRVSSGGGRYMLDPVTKKDAARLLARASRMRAAAPVLAEVSAPPAEAAAR